MAKRSKATAAALVERSNAERRALLTLGMTANSRAIGAAAAADWRKVEQDADVIAQDVAESIEESTGTLPALVKAEIIRSVVYGYVEGYVAGAAMRHAKTIAATRKSMPRKSRKKAESVAKIRAEYGKEKHNKHTKKGLRVKAVAESLRISERTVWSAVADLK
jgi:hypothetical protein